MRPLYEIDADLAALINDDGEVLDEEALTALAMERDEKIEGVVLAIKNLQHFIADMKEEEKALAERRIKYEKKVEGMTYWLNNVLNGEPFETAQASVKFRKSPCTEVTDTAAVIKFLQENGLEDYLKYTDPKIKLTELSNAIKSGKKIPFVQFVEKNNIQIK